jgi:hypothetical protein
MRPPTTPVCVARQTTMLELVQTLARRGMSEREIVRTVFDLVRSGQVVLIGNFRGTPLQDPDAES